MDVETPILDLSEKGRKDGEAISLDRRLFIQILAFGDCTDTNAVIRALTDSGIDAALYADANDARGIGLVTMAEDPNFFVDTLRPLLNAPPFATLTPKPEMTMFGRTYSIGYESDLAYTLLDKPRGRLLNPDLPWAIFYPLKRAGSFEDLAHDEQMKVLGEHGKIGRQYGEAGLAVDLRLACHGLDKNDNDFVTGLLGSELFPLSAVVRSMRKTIQTKHHLTSLGPFFVGKIIWQSKA